MDHFQKIPNFLSLMLRKICRHIYWPALPDNGFNVKKKQSIWIYSATTFDDFCFDFFSMSAKRQYRGGKNGCLSITC